MRNRQDCSHEDGEQGNNVPARCHVKAVGENGHLCGTAKAVYEAMFECVNEEITRQ